jgi:dTDP-4-dehydrorhamnose reductase
VRVLVLGGEGMLGHKVFQTLSPRFEVFATFCASDGLWRDFPVYADVPTDRLLSGVDMRVFATLARALAVVRPQVVINCVGIVKQLREARDPVLTLSINSVFPHVLADLCEAAGARLIHISTDCVFSGRTGHYTEADSTDADDLYGRSKALGEVDRAHCLTIRTSIIGRDFLKQSALLEWFLAQRGGVVRGYRNAIFSGFPTQSLARIMGDIIEEHATLSGLVHVASAPISKLDLLTLVRDAMGIDVTIEPFDDAPCDRSLDPSLFVASTGYRIPTWGDLVSELAADPTPYDDWRRSHAATRG